MFLFEKFMLMIKRKKKYANLQEKNVFFSDFFLFLFLLFSKPCQNFKNFSIFEIHFKIMMLNDVFDVDDEDAVEGSKDFFRNLLEGETHYGKLL